MKCWKVEMFGVESFVFANKRGRATTACAQSCDECGWGNGYPTARTTRAPQYDHLSSLLNPYHPYGEDYFKELLMNPHNQPNSTSAQREVE